jgi:hypothetical protein
MTALARSFNQLSHVEPSFQVIRPWFGGFDVDGHVVRCALDSGDWVRLSASLNGSELDLVRQQSNVPLPVKVVAGPALIAEMPLSDSLATTFLILRSVMHRALVMLPSPVHQSTRHEPDDAEVTARLESFVEGSAFTWERVSDHVLTKAGTATIVGRAFGSSVVFATTVLHLASCSARSLDALTHFVLAANARLRFVRTTFTADRLVEEVALPTDVLTTALVDHAVRAISTGFHTTKRACAALANGNIAEQYLEFHTQGKDHHADTHD